MRVLARAAVAVIGAYQEMVSPLLPQSCRFAPSCSEYARQAIGGHGVGRGAWLGAKRLLRCHPFHPGGYDPPPAAPGGERA
jgi:putative membrane protein insertion efficiency factor